MLKRRILSFKYAFKGIYTLFQTQPNAWIHLTVLLMVIGMSWWLGLSATEWTLIILASAAVLAAEAFNTALEFLTDLVSPEWNELAGKTKDVAAAGVLITAIGAVLVGLFILGPKLLNTLNVTL